MGLQILTSRALDRSGALNHSSEALDLVELWNVAESWIIMELYFIVRLRKIRAIFVHQTLRSVITG